MRGDSARTGRRTAACLLLMLAATGASGAAASPPVPARAILAEEPVRTRLAPATHAASLGQERIRRIVLRAGLAEIEGVRREGDRILVTAVSGDGAAFRLALDAASGDIIGRERLGWARGDRMPPAAPAPGPALALPARGGG